MKKLIKEIVLIVSIAVFIALVFNFASNKSIPLIPKSIEEQTVSTEDLLAAVDDADDYIDTSSASIDSSPAEMSPSEKTTGKDEKDSAEKTEKAAEKNKSGDERSQNAEQNKMEADKAEKKDGQKSDENQSNSEDIAMNNTFEDNAGGETLQPENQGELRFVNYEQVERLVGRKGVQFIDARSKVFFEEGHIGNAIHCHPWKDGKPFINVKKLMKLPRNKTYIVYCTGGTCTDSHEIAKKMLQLGFENVFVYHNGYDEWEQRQNQ